jgi:hypothetical protein
MFAKNQKLLEKTPISLAIFLLLVSSFSLSYSQVLCSVSGSPWGKSTKYMGVNGYASVKPEVWDDLGFNTYRISVRMDRFEPEDDNPPYGSPSIEQIKAAKTETELAKLIDWSKWDSNFGTGSRGVNIVMTYKKQFAYLAQRSIRALLHVRTRNPKRPQWAPMPPFDQKDRAEIWEYCFSVAYWINVRNDFGVDDYEVGNEPDHPDNGWVHSEEDYLVYMQLMKDALEYCYTTFLPGREYRLYAPVCCEPCSSFIAAVNEEAPDRFDHYSFHYYNYFPLMVTAVEDMHRMMDTREGRELWMTEWGTFTDFDNGYVGKNHDIPTTVMWLKFLLTMCYPGENHVDGWHYFPLSYPIDGNALIFRDTQEKSAMYYALRMGIRALQGGKDIFRTETNDTAITALTALDSTGMLDFIAVNTGDDAKTCEVDLSAFITQESVPVTLYRYDTDNMDSKHSDSPPCVDGNVSVEIAGHGAVNIRIDNVTPPVAALTSVAKEKRNACSAVVRNNEMCVSFPTSERREISLFAVDGRCIYKAVCREQSIGIRHAAARGLFLLRIERREGVSYLPVVLK